jgi:BirA family biotin operon repressor/biotin-[acetyl-CoA-carboxylase] ligase
LKGLIPSGAEVPILALDEVDSTNAVARRRSEAGETGPLWITASVQTEGRGRRGRRWETPRGNLAATLLTVLDRPPAEAAGVSFVAALAIADLARAYVPAGLVRLKWPNDVLLGRDKLSGVLIETGLLDSGQAWLALGLGVNLMTAPANVERPASSLAQHLRPELLNPPTPEAALHHLAGSLAYWSARWFEEGFAPIAAAWSQNALGLSGPCAVRLPAETLQGTAEGLYADGALRLRLTDGSLRRITAGDVFLP